MRQEDETAPRCGHRYLVYVAHGSGTLAALIGAAVFAGWFLLGPAVLRDWCGPIYMKTNAALGLLLAGAGLLLLIPADAGRMRRRAGLACAALVLLLGTLTFSEHLIGWNLGIDQLLATEPPGAAAVTSPNRMGPPASLSLALLGLALLLLTGPNQTGTGSASTDSAPLTNTRGEVPVPVLSGRLGHQGRHKARVALRQTLALVVIVVALLPTIGYLYGAGELYAIAWYTGIAWPTAVVLLMLGLGILCARPHEGLMAAVTADDPGGRTIRLLLAPMIVVPLATGWLRHIGERHGLYETALGTSLNTLVFIVTFSALVYYAGRRASHAAAALRDSEKRFRSMANAIPQLAWIARADGYTYWYNQRWYDFTGTTPEQMAGWGWQSVHDAEVLPSVLDEWQASLDTGEPFNMTFPLRGADGVFRPFLTRVMPLKDAHGRVTQWFGTNTDVSEQRRVEEHLKHEKDKAQAYLDIAGVMIVAINAHQEVTLANKRACQVLGCTAAEIVGKNWFDAVLPAQEKDEVKRVFNDLLAGRIEPWEYVEHPLLTKSGEERLIAWHNTVLRDASGQIIATLSSGEDITERKQAEAQLQALNATLEHRVAERTAETQRLAAQLRGLVATLSETEQRERRRLAMALHENLQQLLVAAKLKLTQAQRRAKDEALDASLRAAAQMLDECLAESRLVTVQLCPPVLYSAGLVSALNWLAEQMRNEHDLRVEITADRRAEPADEGIRTLLFQAVRELLVNVIAHAGVNCAWVEVTRLDTDRVQIVVRDEGAGYDPATVENRMADAGAFGLFNIRERVTLLGGNLDVESLPGQGTRVTLVAPLGSA